jgi:tungstate transport system ATP-binding protein
MDNKPMTLSIELHDICILRNERRILGVQHGTISAAGITAIVGPNGAGKTTLLKLIHKLIEPDSGTISKSIHSLRSALVLHHTPMIKASVRCNMGLVRDCPNPPTELEIDAMLKRVQLAHLSKSPATKLSAGERQKLSIGRAALQKPNLYLLDEPTANLDPAASEHVEQMIREFAADSLGVIFTSHQLAQVERLADRVIFIKDGEWTEDQLTYSFFNDPRSDALKKFLSVELVNS